MSEKKFAMLGAGFWASYQLAAWGEVPGARCVGVCDPDQPPDEPPDEYEYADGESCPHDDERNRTTSGSVRSSVSR